MPIYAQASSSCVSQVRALPTVIAFRDGKPTHRFAGAYPEADIRTFVKHI